MSEARYPSKERVERDGVLIHAEGDDLINDPDEATRQGYEIEPEPSEEIATERIERDGVLVAAEGDPIPGTAVAPEPAKKAPARKTPAKKAPAKS